MRALTIPVAPRDISTAKVIGVTRVLMVLALVISLLLIPRAATAPVFAQSAPDVSPPADRPNIIIIYCDDLGYGDLGVTGSRAIATPNIDRMAKEGVRLTDYYACSGVCAPSRAGLLTGRYPFRSGVIGNVYPGDDRSADASPETMWAVRSNHWESSISGKGLRYRAFQERKYF
ncbi:MAG: sulfatase-like hydrolase/transferase [Pseudomonadota bacterium]